MADPRIEPQPPELGLQAQSIRAGTGRSISRDTVQAATEASIAAMAHLNATGPGLGCDLALVLSSGCHSEAPGVISRIVARATGAKVIAGCSGSLLLTDQGLLESKHGVVVLVIRGIDTTAATWPSLALDPSGAGRGLSRALARGRPENQDSAVSGPILALVDPRSLRARLFLRSLRDGLPPGTPVLGGGASVEDGEAWVLAQTMDEDGDSLVGSEDAVAGVCLHNCTVSWGITQSFQAVSELMEVTRIEQDHLLELDGLPALPRLLDLVPDELACDPIALRQDCVLGFPVSGPDQRQHIRPIYVGQARGQGLQISKRLKIGDRVLLAQRDPQLAARDLRDMVKKLRQRAPATPAFGLFINSTDRGDQLFEQPNHGISAIRSAFPDLPILGWHTPRQLAPMEGEPQAMASGAVVALFGTP
jgi:small ligand-binding sensory domain FIST